VVEGWPAEAVATLVAHEPIVQARKSKPARKGILALLES
jgi:hypothetical protein